MVEPWFNHGLAMVLKKNFFKNQYGRVTTYEPQPHVNHITMVAMVPLLTPVDGYYTTFYNHIAMVLTPLRDPVKTMAEQHSILQGLKTKLHRHEQTVYEI